MSGENPYMQLCTLFGGEGSSGLRLLRGSVIAGDPLVIEAAGINLSGDTLSINPALIEDFSGTSAGSGAGNISGVSTAGDAVSGTCETTNTGTCKVINRLRKGDSLMLLTEDYQKFFIISKVVDM